MTDLPSKAMILAAGLGSRLRPLTDHVPKCMVPVHGRPILEHAIRWLSRHGVTEIAMNVCYLREAIQEHFGDGRRFGVRLVYSEEQSPLGTAGGVKRLSWFFDNAFFVWYGDNLSTCNLARLFQLHCERKAMVTMALFSRPDVSQSGIVDLAEDDRILRFLEKPKPEEVFSHWVNAGILVMERQVLDLIPDQGTPDFSRDIFPAMLAGGMPLYGYRMTPDEGLWWIDTPQDYQRLEELAGSGQIRLEDGVQ